MAMLFNKRPWPYGNAGLHRDAAYRGWRTRRRRLAGDLTPAQREEAAQQCDLAREAEAAASQFASFTQAQLDSVKREIEFRDHCRRDPGWGRQQRALMPRDFGSLSAAEMAELRSRYPDVAATSFATRLTNTEIKRLTDDQLRVASKRLARDLSAANRDWQVCVRKTKWFTSIKGEE